MGILVKDGIALTDGFVRFVDAKIIPSMNVKIKTILDQPTLLDEAGTIQMIGEAIAKAKVELLSTDDIENIKTNYDAFIKANSTIQHNTFEVVDIEYTGTDTLYSQPNNVIESFIYDGTEYKPVTNQVFQREFLKTILDELAGALLEKAQDDQVIKKDGTTPFESTYTPTNDYDPEYVSSVKAKIASARQEIRGIGSTKTIVQIEGILSSFENRLGIVEGNPASQYKSAIRKWTGLQSGSATSATANTTTIALATLVGDDNKVFDFTANKEIRLWVKGTAGTAFNVPIDLIVGSAEPTLVEAVKGATGTTLEVLSAQLGTDGNLIITRNAGSAIDFTTIKVFFLKEDVLALANTLVSQDQRTADRTEFNTALNNKLDKTLDSLVAHFQTASVENALLQIAGTLQKVIDTDTLEDGKDYVVRKIANQKPVYYAINAVLKTDKAHKKGQITIFNEEQVAPSKFADTTLFGYSLKPAVTTPDITLTKTKTFSGKAFTVDLSNTFPGYVPVRIIGAYFTNSTNGDYISSYLQDDTNVHMYFKQEDSSREQKISLNTNTKTLVYDGASASGRLATAVVEFEKTIPGQTVSDTRHQYVAKKDITFAEMGE